MKQSKILKNSVVSIHYRLTLDDGTVADDTAGREPFVYLHGHQNIVPGLEQQLDGRAPGDAFECSIEPELAYGQFEPRGVQQVPRNAFPKEPEPAAGMMFHTQTRDGRQVPVWIKRVTTEQVTIDYNHPLAGQRLNYTITIVDIRKATREEMQHGHVHGPGGHHH